VHAGAEILERHPDLRALANFDRKIIEAAWTGAFGIKDLPVERKAAVVAGAMVVALGRAKINKATGMRADDVESADLVIFKALQVNGTDGNVRGAVPRIDLGGENGELSRFAVFWDGTESGDENRATGFGFSAQGIHEDGETGEWRDDGDGATDGDGGGFGDKIASVGRKGSDGFWFHA